MKQIKTKLFVIMSICFFMTTIHAKSADYREQNQQEKTITGKVTSAEDTDGLPGVNVIVKGTTQGTVTDIQGMYSLEVAGDIVLVFSSVGYIQQEVAVNNQSIIDIVMNVDVTALDEIVVVGYGTQKKQSVTGSISDINGDELVKSPSANVAANLQGRLPGLTSNQRTGEPGRDNPELLIRGKGTFGNNAPLVIIDGVQRGDISRLNPDDIESVSVLKDASAAIYGARSANGVILVTTKAGKIGKPVFDFSYNYGFSNPTQSADMLDAATYAQIFNEGDWYDKKRPDTYTPYYSDEEIQKYGDGSDPISYPNTNWSDATLKKNPAQQRINMSATGGSENVKYLLSFGYLSQEGNYVNNPTDYQQYNIRTNIDVNLTDNLSVGANLSSIINKSTYSSQGTWTNFYNIIRALPTMTAVYPNGLIAPGRFGQNPLLLDQRGYTDVDANPIYTTFTTTWKIPWVKGLRIDGSFNFDQTNSSETTWDLPYYYHEYNVNTGEYDLGSTSRTSPALTDRYNRWTTMMWNYRLVYENTFGKNNVTGMLGQEQQQNDYNWVQAYRQNYVSSAIDQINVGSNAPEDKDNAGSETESAYNNFFGRVTYDYDAKYLAEFLFRYDGSQIFPEGNRYGFFPGVSVGWRMSEENFIKNNLKFVDQLKLRLSYGEVGNDLVGQYQYLQTYSFGHNYVYGTSDVPGIYANTMPNPNITWEVAKKLDFGFEFDLWNGLLGMDLTLWKENRSNILAQRNLSIPYILGFPSLPSENIGEVDNHGFELVLTHRNKINDFGYFISGNIAFAQSEIVYMDEVPNAEEYQNLTGMPVGSSLYYETDGIFNTQEELDNYPHRASAQLGDIKYVDKNDDGVINDQDKFRYDLTATPEWVGGLTIGMNYKNFDLNIFFQGQTGVVNYASRFEDLGTTEPANSYVERAEDRWTVDNPNGTMPRARHDNAGENTFFLYDASFIRLKDVQIGYTLPKEFVSKIRLQNLRFYVSGFNLLTWATEITYTDPEVNGQSIYYPQLRVINFGVNLQF